MCFIAVVSGGFQWQTWLVVSLLSVVVTSTHVRHEGVMVLRRPCGSPDISWHNCIVKKGCSWDDDDDVVRIGQSRCYHSVIQTRSNASSRLRTMRVPSEAWRTSSESTARTVPCLRPNAADQESRDRRMSSNNDGATLHYEDRRGEIVIEKEEIVIEKQIHKTKAKPSPEPKATELEAEEIKHCDSYAEEFVKKSAISPEVEELDSIEDLDLLEDWELQEPQLSESSEVAIESEPEIGIESSLAFESRTEALLTLDEPTNISSHTSLEAEAISSEDGEEALLSEYAEEAISSDYGEEAVASDYGEEAVASDYAEESVESPSPSLSILRRTIIAEDRDLEEYGALAILLEALRCVDAELTFPKITTELHSGELTSKPAMPSNPEPAGDIEVDSVPSLPSLLDVIQESMTFQTADEEIEAPGCAIAPVASPRNKKDLIIIPLTSSAPSPTPEDEDMDFNDGDEEDEDLIDEETASVGAPSSEELSLEEPSSEEETSTVAPSSEEADPVDALSSEELSWEEAASVSAPSSEEADPVDAPPSEEPSLEEETSAGAPSSEEADPVDAPSLEEALGDVPIPPPLPISAKNESVAPKLSVPTEAIGYIEDPSPDTPIETTSPEIAQERLEYLSDMEGYDTLSDTDPCSQDTRSPLRNVPCSTTPPQSSSTKTEPSSAKTEPCEETEESDAGIGEEMEGYALISPSIKEISTETHFAPTQEPAPASEPAPAKQTFYNRTVHPQSSEAKESSKMTKPTANPPAQKDAKSHKTKKTPQFPKSGPSATSAEAGSRRSTGPAVTYPELQSPVYQSRRRFGQQHQPSDVMTQATSGTEAAAISHLDRAWDRKDYSKRSETATGRIRFSRDKAQQYGRWKPAETEFTTHQPDRFRAKTASADKCIVYRRVPCGKKNIKEKACRARGCCWLKISRQYWKRGCYQPKS